MGENRFFVDVSRLDTQAAMNRKIHLQYVDMQNIADLQAIVKLKDYSPIRIIAVEIPGLLLCVN